MKAKKIRYFTTVTTKPTWKESNQAYFVTRVYFTNY
jgi:preprotein translocase subunit Sss1